MIREETVRFASVKIYIQEFYQKNFINLRVYEQNRLFLTKLNVT